MSNSLHELIRQDPQSKALYDSLPKDAQVALQEQQQCIRTREELTQAVRGFEKRSGK